MTFARADALQSADHVQALVVDGPQMTAEIRGTWSRMDRSSVLLEGKQLTFQCTCNPKTICRHCVAMLLHSVRKPDAFRKSASERAALPAGVAQKAMTPEEQMET